MTEGSSILVVGSVAFDDVRTPFGAGENLLGGSATHFSVAASYFAPVRLVAVVGEDFADPHAAALRERGVDLSGLQRRAGRTFRWAGEYDFDLNNPRTLDTQLNVFAEFTPELPPGWEDTPVVFLANIDPELQSRVRSMVREPRLVAADTMNFWIAGKPDALRQTLVALASGHELAEHNSPGEATLQVLRGHVRLIAGDDTWDGAAGDQITIPPVRHALEALEDSAVLLTVSVSR